MSDCVFLIILLVLLTCSFWIWYRNNKVYTFYCYIGVLSYEYNIRRINENSLEYKDAFIWFADKHTYDSMVLSFKPLKLEYWYTKEELEEINR